MALGLLLGFELTVVLALRGMSLAQYLESRDPVSGTAYVCSLALFALMPSLLGSTGWSFRSGAGSRR
jgi:hypothetical protein